VVEDPLEREQQLDFVTARRFRQTLLCRAEAAPRQEADVGAMRALAVSAPLERVGSTRFAAGHERTLETDDAALLGALDRIAAAWPGAAPVADLTADATARARVEAALLDCYAAGLVELHVAPPDLARRAGTHPEASPLARQQARAGDEVTSLRHAVVRLQDESARHLVGLLDGARDRAELAAAMTARLGKPHGDVAAALDRGLARLAELGLLLR
jgi:hypothetical protein